MSYFDLDMQISPIDTKFSSLLSQHSSQARMKLYPRNYCRTVLRQGHSTFAAQSHGYDWVVVGERLGCGFVGGWLVVGGGLLVVGEWLLSESGGCGRRAPGASIFIRCTRWQYCIIHNYNEGQESGIGV